MGTKKQNSLENSLIIGTISLVVFIVNLYVGRVKDGLFNENFSVIKKISPALLTASFFTGIFSFIPLISELKKRIKRRVKKYSRADFSLAVIIILLLFSVSFIYAKNKELTQAKKEQTAVSIPTSIRKPILSYQNTNLLS